MSEFPKKYHPQSFEQDIYASWEEKKLFQPQDRGTGKSYYIPMPPPNVTAALHV